MISALFNSSILFEGTNVEEPEVEEIEELKEVEETLDEYPNADEDSLDEIETEAVRDFASLEAASYIVDVITFETAIVHGEERGMAVMEGAIKDTFVKIKEFLIKIAKKIKAFFLKLIQNIQVFFMNGVDFVKKYKKDLIAKKVDGFEKRYHQMKYAELNTVDKFADGFGKYFKAITGQIKTEDILKKVANREEVSEEFSDSDMERDIKKVTGGEVETTGDLRPFLDKACGLEGDPELIVEFKSGPSVQAMIKFVEDSNSILQDAKSAQVESERIYKELIDKIDGVAKKFADDSEGDASKNALAASYAKKLISRARKIGTFVIACRKTKVEVATAMQRETVSVLKSFMYRSPKVEKNSADFGYGSNRNMFDSFSI
jgi:hypothetical protein